MAVFTVEEVRKHSKESDCWVIYRGKVYDVTPFVSDHPGGQEVLLEHAGTDATEAFEDIGHSESAYEMLNDFYIGELAELESATEDGGSAKSSAKPEAVDANAPQAKPEAHKLPSKPSSSSFSFAKSNNIPIAVGFGAVLVALTYHAFFR